MLLLLPILVPLIGGIFVFRQKMRLTVTGWW